MRFRQLVAVVMLSSPLAWGAAYTASVTGNWADVSTWGGSGPPGDGDTVTINSGVTVTIPVSTSVTIGADSATAAIQCATSNGTGILVVNGTLTYKGDVSRCNGNWTIGAGATLHHSSAASHYYWKTATGTSVYKLTASGSSGSPITWDNTGASGYTGGINGQLDFNYVNMSKVGSVAGTCATATGGCSFYAGSLPSGATFSIHNSTCDSCGAMFLQSPNSNVTISLVGNRFTNSPASGTVYGFIDGHSWGTPTGGTREITDNFFSGGIWISSTGYLDVGLTLKRNTFWFVGTASSVPGLALNSISMNATNFDYNLLWTRDLSSAKGAPSTSSLPAGTWNHLALMGSNANNDSGCVLTHFNSNTFANATSLGGFNGLIYNINDSYIEPDCGWVGNNGFVNNHNQYLTTVNVNRLINNQGKNGIGSSILSLVEYTTSIDPACGGVDCTTVNIDHTTNLGSVYSSAYAEASNLAGSGQWTITNSIYYNVANTTCSGATNTGIPPVALWAFNYNAVYNCSTALDSGVTGGTSGAATITNQQSLGNPSFTNASFNMLSWCQSLNPADATWSDCAAHFAAGTAGYTPQAFFTALYSAMAPRTTAYGNSGLGGTYLGALPLGSVAKNRMQGAAKIAGTARTRP